MKLKVTAKPDASVNAYFIHFSRWRGLDYPPEFTLITEWAEGVAELELEPGEYVFSVMIEGAGSALEFDCDQTATNPKPKITTPRGGKWSFTFNVPKKELRRLFHVYCIVGEPA